MTVLTAVAAGVGAGVAEKREESELAIIRADPH